MQPTHAELGLLSWPFSVRLNIIYKLETQINLNKVCILMIYCYICAAEVITMIR